MQDRVVISKVTGLVIKMKVIAEGVIPYGCRTLAFQLTKTANFGHNLGRFMHSYFIEAPFIYDI